MKRINSYIIEKLHLTNNNKDNLKGNIIYGVDNELKLAKKLNTYVYTDFHNKINEKSLSGFSKWVHENNVTRFKAYYNNTDHLGTGIKTSTGSIEYNPKNVNIYVERLDKYSLITMYSDKDFNIICNEPLKKSDEHILYVSTPDTRFVILKDN